MYHFDMIVSGIYDTPNGKSESVIVSKAFMEENPEMMNEIAQGREGCGIYDADVIMRDSSMVKERISEFVRSIGGNPDDRSAENYVRVAPNTFLSNNSGGSIMWLVAGVFGVLFMFCGYLLIYNVFEIAVTNDIRQYGLLRTVGTTSQQIKRLVNRQALYLFLIGTPFGLFLASCSDAVFFLRHSRCLQPIIAVKTLRSAHFHIWALSQVRSCSPGLRFISAPESR